MSCRQISVHDSFHNRATEIPANSPGDPQGATNVGSKAIELGWAAGLMGLATPAPSGETVGANNRPVKAKETLDRGLERRQGIDTAGNRGTLQPLVLLMVLDMLSSFSGMLYRTRLLYCFVRPQAPFRWQRLLYYATACSWTGLVWHLSCRI